MTAAVDDPKQLGKTVERWDTELRAYEKATEKWRKSAKRIAKRYALRDHSEDREERSRFNILWSNVQTQSPALFANPPVPVIERRFRDKDPVGRIAAQMLERAVSTDLEFDEIDVVLGQVSLDFQLAGRGIDWVRYEADIRRVEVEVSTTPEGVAIDPEGGVVEEPETREDGSLFMAREEIARERAPVDFVFWEDFYHKVVKSWKDLERNGWIARRVRMTRAEGIERFGEIFKEVPLKVIPEGVEDKDADKHDVVKSAEVFEIWDAADKRVIWINRDFQKQPLDEVDDPLGLESFFPAPRAAYTTLTNDSLIPVPDYLQYEDLAEQLDDVTDRIATLTKALRVKGIYDASMEKLASLLEDGGDNTMYPVENMTAILAKGSTGTTLQNIVQFLPIEVIAKVLLLLYDARDRIKETLFEVSGLSDILRGQVDPREKLGQSRIKGQFATLRLDTRQKEMARMARDTIRIKAEIIAEKFTPENLREISGFDQLSDVEKMRRIPSPPEGVDPQLFQMQAQQQAELQVEQVFQQAVQLIRDDKSRGFRIDVETNSTVELDEQAEKESRVELLAGIGAFLQQALPIVQAAPEMGPVLLETMLFAMRAFKAGRNVESLFEDVIEQMRDAAENPQPPPPDPEMLKAQGEQEDRQARLQMDQQERAARLQFDQQKAGAEITLNREKASAEMRLKAAQMQADTQLKAQMLQIEAALKQFSEASKADTARREKDGQAAAQSNTDTVLKQLADAVQAAVQTQQQTTESMAAVVEEIADAFEAAAKQISAEKVIVRDESGRVTGVRTNGAA